MNRFAGQKQKHRCREQTYGHQGGKVAGGGGGMNWAIGIDMYILICIKQITNKNLLYKKIKFKNSKQKQKQNYRKQHLGCVIQWEKFSTGILEIQVLPCIPIFCLITYLFIIYLSIYLFIFDLDTSPFLAQHIISKMRGQNSIFSSSMTLLS